MRNRIVTTNFETVEIEIMEELDFQAGRLKCPCGVLGWPKGGAWPKRREGGWTYDPCMLRLPGPSQPQHVTNPCRHAGMLPICALLRAKRTSLMRWWWRSDGWNRQWVSIISKRALVIRSHSITMSRKPVFHPVYKYRLQPHIKLSLSLNDCIDNHALD